MRFTKTKGLAAAGIAVAMVAAPLPALAEETTTDAATGDLTVTRFDDRYADGLYDPSKVSAYGQSDQLRSGPAQLVDVNGKRWYISPDADGLYRFTDVPVGPATLYLGYPNNPPREVIFDATGATSAADVTRLDTREYFGPQGALDLVITEGDQERLIGMTALGVNAKVTYADGSVASGLTSIEFGSNGDWFTGSEYAGLAGGYAALIGYSELRHLPGDLGMRVTAPEGYKVASVEAFTGSAPISYPDIPMTLTERDGAYWVDSLEVPQYFFAASFHVTLEEDLDTVRPQTTLVSPATAGPLDDLQIQVDATDDRGLNRIVANLYKDGKLLKSTQSAVADGAKSGTHTASIGGLADGEYTLRYNASDLAGNISQTRNFAFTIDDSVRPQTTLVSPTTAGPFQKLSVQVDATDNNGLKRIVANIYKDGKLVKSTQSAVANGAKSGSHTATVTLPDGDYTVRYNSSDLAGNISQTRNFAFTIDATAPTVTVKEGAPYTVYHGGEVTDSYNKVSFKLYDAGKIDRVEINGVVKDLSNNAWSDVNFVKPGTFGAVRGENTLVVYDVAGNTTTVTFRLK